MFYSKFNDNQEDADEATLVSNASNTTTTVTTSSESELSLSVERVTDVSSSLNSKTVENITVPNLITSQKDAPYINRNYLKQLDTSSLERNMQIRHDLVIEKGFKVTLPQSNLSEEDEEAYWNSIKKEVTELQLNIVNDAPRLRSLICEIREMMIELYPKCEVVSGEFAEFLEDSEFIIQQIKNGALEVGRFYLFLGNAMKKNCAPKRDFLVDSMISNPCPIEALKCTLKLIELMKLDLANFKLDQLRPLIAKSSIATEKAFFSQLFQSGKLSLELTRKWLIDSNSAGSDQQPIEVFKIAGIKLLVNPFVKGADCNVPETFILDKKRLISLHSKFQDLCIVQCLLLIFKQASSNDSSSEPLNMKRFVGARLLKPELLRLLEHPDTQITDISNLLIQCLKDCNINSIDFGYIHSALNNIISPENELFLLVEKKLLHRIKTKLFPTDEKESNSSSGLSELNVLEEFDELIEKFGILLQFNWSVFEPVYQDLLLKK